MARNWIVLGDVTASGGRVITASLETDIDGDGVARFNDKATCPLHKGVFPIVGGCDPTIIIDGHAVALHGATLACGCKVLATKQMRVFVDAGGGGGGTAGVAQAAAVASAAKAGGSAQYDEAFILVSELTGEPLANRQYKIIRKDGMTEEGTSDENGTTHPSSALGRATLGF